MKRRSLLVVVVSLTFLSFFILAFGSFRIVVGGSLHGRDVSSGKRSKRIIIKRGHQKGKLVDGHLLILALLVAQELVLALTGVMAPSKYTLEHPQDTTGGGRGVTRRRSS
jgi:hypothetical protein